MRQKEVDFLQTYLRVQEGTKTITETAEHLSVSYHTMQRRLVQFSANGKACFVHKLRGRPPNHCISLSGKSHIIDILTTHYLKLYCCLCQ